MLSKFLKERIDLAKTIVDDLSNEFEYVSIFGKHAKGKRIMLNAQIASIGESPSLMETEAGFVIKIYHNHHYSEYSLDDIKDYNKDEMLKEIALNNLNQEFIKVDVLKDEKLVIIK